MTPLAGVKVLDFSRVLAGPLCTQSLADLGAEVIKVESIGTGDETRGWPPIHSPGFGGVFLAVNRNKRSIALDLKAPEGIEVAHKLAGQADVVVENFSTGVADRLGIGAKDLTDLNPRLIYCSISGYGRTGPLAKSAGYDVVLQAFSGMMSLTGEPNGGHIRIPISPIDQVTGLHAVSGIMAALIERGRTGKGSQIELSLLDTAIGLLGYSLQSYWEKGVQPDRWGSTHESLCPYRVFDALDGPVLIGVANDNLWRKFCPVAGLQDLGADPRFSTNAGRATHRSEIERRVQDVVRERSAQYWTEALTAIGVPVAPLNSLAQMLEHPQTVENRIILDYDLAPQDRVSGVAYPMLLDGARQPVRHPPPRLGEHSADILTELGMSAGEIERLLADGVVAGASA